MKLATRATNHEINFPKKCHSTETSNFFFIYISARGSNVSSLDCAVTLSLLKGGRKWDLIHFNCGLGDLIHRMPKINSFRVMPRHAGGIRTTSAKNYKNNLNLLPKYR